MAGYIGTRVVIDTSGFKDLVKIAESRSITLKGVKAGIKLLQIAAKAAAPRRVGSGALKQSQGTKAKKGSKGRTLSFAIQGAKTKFVKMAMPRGYQNKGLTKSGRRRWSHGYKTPQKIVPAYYDHLVQGGTRPHSLNKGAKLKRSKLGRLVQTLIEGKGSHPGTKPNPYRRRAYESIKDAVGATVNVAMGSELKRIIAKNAAKLNAGVK